MYVCIEVALCGDPMERGVQLGLGKGPIKWVQCPNPADTSWLILAQSTFCSQHYSGQLRVICNLI